MPIIKSAKKALRQTKRRTVFNQRALKLVKKATKTFKAKPTLENFKEVVSQIDKTTKKKLYHPNKANRLKKQLNKLLVSKDQPKKKKADSPKKSASKKPTRAKMKKKK